MNPTPDPLVRAALGAGPAPAGPHPDAEVLGLYSERALEGDELRGVETHVAACVRCQAIVAAIAATAPEDAPATGTAGATGLVRWFSGWRWVVPAASLAALAIVAVWIGQPSPERSSSAPPASLDHAVTAPPASSQTSRVRPPSQAAGEAPAATAPQPTATMTQKRETEARLPVAARATPPAAPAATANSPAPAARDNRAEATLADAAGVPAPAPAAPEATAASAEGRAEKAVAAPAAESRMARSAPRPAGAAPSALARRAATVRVTAGRLEYSADDGRTWRQATTPAGLSILAASEVSPGIAWAIAAGAVLRTTDGDRWTEVPAPPGAPFSAVTAAGADRAIVTAAGGARYATTDGGRSWRRVP